MGGNLLLPPFLFLRDIDGNSFLFLHSLNKTFQIDILPHIVVKKLLLGIGKKVGNLVVHIGMDLHEQAAFRKSYLDRLIDDVNGCPYLYPGEKRFDVLWVEPDTAMANESSDAPWHVGAVDAVIVVRQSEPILAQRIVGAWRDTFSSVFFVQSGRDVPRRVFCLLHHPKAPERRRPILDTNTNRVRFHHVDPIEKKVESQLRDIDNDAPLTVDGEHPGSRDQNSFTSRRKPGIDGRIQEG